jgi:photosynthetic reaction center H subunit
MVGVEFFGDFDLASAAIWAFWLFFAILVIYLQTENQREGYPLTDENGDPSSSPGLFPTPKAKTFELPNDRGSVTVPSHAREAREVALQPGVEGGGSPMIPTGDPMIDGVGPASWAPRRDIAEIDAHGHAKIKPLSVLEEFRVSAGRDPRGLPVVAGDGEVVGRITDMWIDVPEQMVRYLTLDLNPEGSGQTRLVPLTMARIQSDRVTVRSLYQHNFAGVPQIAGTEQITLLEEEKICAYYAGGTMYADPKRAEPCI